MNPDPRCGLWTGLATRADESLRNETIRSIEAWKDAPFRPHVIARYRQQAYMHKTLMAYLDNLIAWGDSLFRLDTGEAIDEAMMVYVLAANILGPRPQPVPKKGTVRPQTYANLRRDLSQFGSAVRDVEADLPFDLMLPLTMRAIMIGWRRSAAWVRRCTSARRATTSCWVTGTLSPTAYSRSATASTSRVFFVHLHCSSRRSIRPCWHGPLLPGLDVDAIINGLNQPLPLVRFQLLVQKPADICQEVKSLGNNLLSAMEKEDGEAMAILRARHERVVLEMVEQVRYAQLQEAIKSKSWSLLPAHQNGRGEYPLCNRPLRRRQLHADIAEEQYPQHANPQR